ncbi:MAG: phosphonate ABC transporter ATP-binding protein [Spirochaetales bacterium]|nr:phosphonate ABC transporter ATP-binding protein [Spirochaetales bacterium]
MLEVKNLTKIYSDGTVALKNVSFTVQDGEFLVVIGLSGSGKSTLLRCINRLIDPTEGDILWNGVNTTTAGTKELRVIRRKIGMVFQHFNLVKRSSVMTNVLCGRLGYVSPAATLIGRFSRQDTERAYRAMDMVGIRDQAKKRADELSGGQQQRVGIARALMQEPEMILADEPVASLDPVLAHTILGYIEKINQQTGVTVLCSLHYLDLVQRYATRVIGLKAGEIVYEGTKNDILNMTDTQFKEIYGEEAQRVGTGSITGGTQL